jgi:hypothetical protein
MHVLATPNPVSLALQYSTPDLIAKIGSALGVDKSSIGKVATASLPALMGGFVGIATKPVERKALDKVNSQKSSGIFHYLVSSIGGRVTHV